MLKTRICIVLSVAWLLVGCGSGVPANQQAKWAVADAQNNYDNGMSAVRQFDQDQSGRCDTPDVTRASMNIISLAAAPQIQDFIRYRINLLLSLGDAGLRKKCYDLAEANYKEVINVYVGLAYTGYRDRAKVGLDDIRAARR